MAHRHDGGLGNLGHQLDHWRQRHEGINHREVCGFSRGKRSEGCNPKGATGMKQGWNGPRRSARRGEVKNQARRLLGGGNSEMTCFFGLDASKGEQTP
jgi:hypothetical protein